MSYTSQSFSRAILHIDGDAFFASCEVAMNPTLQGKPVVTGSERGVVTSMSYEAKRRGVTRGMRIGEVMRVCPGAVILPSDYETYSLFSKRMYAIVRRYTPSVEEYSIDECFADITGLERPLKMWYEDIAQCIKRDLETELGMAFSMGLAPNKILAKLGSRRNKPSGLTIISRHDIEKYLADTDIEKVWGINSQVIAHLRTWGIATALQFATTREARVVENLGKSVHRVWRELRGELVFALTTEHKQSYYSISKTKTFAAPSNDSAVILAQLAKNIEDACVKARRHHVAPQKIFFFLKTQESRNHGLELTLTTPGATSHEIVRLVTEVFEEVYRPGIDYRTTGVVLMDLQPEESAQADLPEGAVELQRWRRVFATVDALDAEIGKHTVFLGSGFHALREKARRTVQELTATRDDHELSNEHPTQRPTIPMLGYVT